MLANFLIVTSLLITPLESSIIQATPLSGKELKARFEALDTAGDHSAVVALFRSNPNGVMFLIDSYLEGSLALFEKEGSAKADEIQSMHSRAIRGAKAASDAFMSPDILDYASSFAGWNDEEKMQFRAGQKACRASSKAHKAKDYEAALKHAQAGLDAAWPLGDWWGTAMAMSAQGRAYIGLDQPMDALRSLSTARILYHGLALYRSARGQDLQMVPLMLELGRFPRANATIDRGLAAANRYNDARSKISFLELRADLESRTGNNDAATKTRAEAEDLKAKQEKK